MDSMPHLSKELCDADQKWISTQIRQSYNQVVTENTLGCVRLEKFNLVFLLTVNTKNSRFQASLLKLSDCLFPADGPIEIPVEPLYAATFDFVEGMRCRWNDAITMPENEPVVHFVHEELGRLFERLTLLMIKQIEKQ
jgi:hypothetical protein